ncbi:hypothetical protein Rfer_4445 (plasmid) [Rhodoferax ferrireducens T118]|uniref:Transmembrane protein n=1 Tax=Albidiferax ferrireducens (strain ATCC BAA-621 / DSM 15236 / T118) TaxID=338969 RepID=Q21Q14_ALBFT|nr:hypothetical protein [Rhodoferax ferrireducens]ABD72131.1 hypothetical protein Rfer_4445 [Rhodoferax ferrireducens T118]
MLALIEFVVWLFVLPYVLFGMLLGHFAFLVFRTFEPRMLLAGVWFATLGLYLLPKRVPDELPFVSLVDSIAQSHIAGLSTPLAFLVMAGLLTVSAAVVAARRATRAIK